MYMKCTVQVQFYLVTVSFVRFLQLIVFLRRYLTSSVIDTDDTVKRFIRLTI